MKIILFGMPGTGKTTAVRNISKNALELDLGSEKLSDKQLEKLRDFTAQLTRRVNFDALSSYPLYFNIDELVTSDVRIYVAIPSEEDFNLILQRVETRGDKDFAHLYRKMISSGTADGVKKGKPYAHRSNVRIVRYFDNSTATSGRSSPTRVL